MEEHFERSRLSASQGLWFQNPHGLTPLQRIGVGLVFSIFAMVAAAFTEVKRLKAAQSHGLANNPTAEIPLSVFWLVPQFFFVGSGEAFTYIGQLDFFLRECPKGMKTLSTGLFLSTLSLGSSRNVHTVRGGIPCI
ncbi:protein nrt1/ ptr family 6.3 [Quercus suber]|uniref:Protein nrt1/ ptr family 6.3 n=1 Tax=Quercus suber TaxID=58331 RepID=A0AAW0JG73_QUESU